MFLWQDYLGTGIVWLITLVALVPLFVPLRKLYRFLRWRRAPVKLLHTTTNYEKIPGLVGGIGGQRRSVFGHVPKVTYSYDVAGEPYTSSQVVDSLERLWFTTQERAEGFLRKIQSRVAPTCYYDPTSPGRSVLSLRTRVVDFLAVGVAVTLVPALLNLSLVLLPEPRPALDFPLYPQAQVMDRPSEEDSPKVWSLTTSQEPGTVKAYYDSQVTAGWEPWNSWEGEEATHTYRIWQRPTEDSQWEIVLVRIRREVTLVRLGFEIGVTYETRPNPMPPRP